MTPRDMAALVLAYFTAGSPSEAAAALGVLADAVEESGADPAPLRAPGFVQIVEYVGGRIERPKFWTIGEREAYFRGSYDADPNGLVNSVWDSEEDYRKWQDNPYKDS